MPSFKLQVIAWVLLALLLSARGHLVAFGDEPDQPSAAERRDEARRALEQFNSLIGEWRGVGQPTRGSNKGAWSETGQWIWELRKEQAGLRYNVKDGKQLVTGLLTFDPEEQRFRFEAEIPDKGTRSYEGRLNGNKLVLESAPDQQGVVHQVVITRLNEKRTLVLYQSRKGKQQQFSRVAEVGYTREGTHLAEEGADGPECIVTGGKGTMKAEYKGKTYYFCCTGCKDAFLEDPEGILEEAAKREQRKRDSAARKKSMP
jgi:YHS domain-containing protein